MADDNISVQAADNASATIRIEPTASMPVAPPAGSPAPSTASSQGRPHYTPQFSATTEMILKRIRGQPSNLNSAISSASASGTINQTSYEDAKRRLVMSMNTSISLSIPAPTPRPPQRYAPALRPPQNDSQNPLAMSVSMPMLTPATKQRGRPPKMDQKGKISRGAKRKRGKEDDDASSVLSDPPDSDEDNDYQDAAPTMTKSGRQILKPTQFTPATEAAVGKRKHYGKRTAEQALCKVCTRGLSPINNQVVFCDGCNLCWHQMCHDPYIDDGFVSDESKSWFCRGCLAKREKHLAKKKNLSGFKGVSWAAKTTDQRRTYLTGLSQSQLVNLAMYTLELHPDLPIFPEGNGVKRGRPSHAQLAAKASPASPGPIHFTKSAATPDVRSSNGTTADGRLERNERGKSEDVPAAWPKIGSGMLAGMSLHEDDFDDKNDFESFSVATYDARTGKKVVENGMPVVNQEAAASAV